MPEEKSLAEKFSWIVDNNYWACPETPCGSGSTLATTAALRVELNDFFEEIRGAVRLHHAVDPDKALESYLWPTFVDLPCGDFHWMKHVNLTNVNYVGVDVVESLIRKNQEAYATKSVQYLCTRRFMVADATKWEWKFEKCLPDANVVLVKDLFLHLSRAHIHGVLKNVAERCHPEFFLASTCLGAPNDEIESGGGFRPVDLEVAPFYLPPPERRLSCGVALWHGPTALARYQGWVGHVKRP